MVNFLLVPKPVFFSLSNDSEPLVTDTISLRPTANKTGGYSRPWITFWTWMKLPLLDISCDVLKRAAHPRFQLRTVPYKRSLLTIVAVRMATMRPKHPLIAVRFRMYGLPS